MNPLYQRYALAAVRAVLLALSGQLVKGGWVESGISVQFATGLSMFLVTLGWSWLEKHDSQLKLLVALMMPPGSTEHEAEVVVNTADSLPVATTPKTAPPVA